MSVKHGGVLIHHRVIGYVVKLSESCYESLDLDSARPLLSS